MENKIKFQNNPIKNENKHDCTETDCRLINNSKNLNSRNNFSGLLQKSHSVLFQIVLFSVFYNTTNY